MKTLIKPLLVAFSLMVVSLSASFATINPGSHPATVAPYKTGIYSTVAGKLNIALDKEVGGAVDVKLKSADGRVLFVQHVGKNEKAARIRLNMDDLQDGEYQVEVTNGAQTTVHNVTLSTPQPSTPSRLVAIN